LIFQTWLIGVLGRLSLFGRIHGCDKSKVLNDFFGVFCFTSARFSTNRN